MKKLYNKIAFIAFASSLIISMASCGYSEDSLEPSGDALTYKLPQGNNDYDQTIVDFYNKYGTYILYDFSDKDAYWTPSGWKNGVLGTTSTGKTGFIVTKAEPSYISQQLALLKKVWFDSYSEKFLKAMLPVKILLCSEVDSVGYNFKTTPFSVSGFKVGAWYNYYNICVANGCSDITSLTSATTRTFKDKINRVFIQSIIDRAIVTPTEEFSSATNYSAITSSLKYPDLWALGTFPQSYQATAARDWGIFMLMMVTHSETFLSVAPANFSTTIATEASWQGILSAAKDKKGILKKRYDMVRNYFIQNYDTDLQEIGNHLND